MAQKALATKTRKPRTKPRPSDTEPRFSREFLKVNSVRVQIFLVCDRLTAIAALRTDDISATRYLRALHATEALRALADRAPAKVISNWPLIDVLIDKIAEDLLNEKN